MSKLSQLIDRLIFRAHLYKNDKRTNGRVGDMIASLSPTDRELIKLTTEKDVSPRLDIIIPNALQERESRLTKYIKGKL